MLPNPTEVGLGIGNPLVLLVSLLQAVWRLLVTIMLGLAWTRDGVIPKCPVVVLTNTKCVVVLVRWQWLNLT